MPIYLSNIVIGYLFFGHVFSYSDHETGWKNISKKCSNYHVNPQDLKSACKSCPIVKEDYLLSASHLLHTVATYLCMERMATLRRENLPIQIDQYITEHFTEDIDVKSICEQFKIGKTYLYKIAKESYGMGIAELIRSLRIEKAKSLILEHPELSINNIASLCGFHDYNYFITVFKKLVGTPPKRFIITEENIS